MPKFKYTPKKDGITQNITNNNQDEQVPVKEDIEVKPQTTNVIKNETFSQIKPQPFPKTTTPIVDKEKDEANKKVEPLSLLLNNEIKEDKTEVEEKTTPAITKEVTDNEIKNIINEQPKEYKEIIPKEKTKPKFSIPKDVFKNFKLNKKLIGIIFAIVLIISLIIGIVSVSNNNKYTITTQDLVATYSNTIKEGALIDIKNSVPLNLSIRDFNISTNGESKEIILSFWDFTDTNKNKVNIYVNDEIKDTNVVFTKKPYKIKVPMDAKVTIMQIETTSSPYTPYAMSVEGTTYFNRTSSDKTNTYQFLVMQEKQTLTLEDFQTEETIDDESEEIDE